MTREELKQYLPHREPMLLVDEIVEEEGCVRGHYRVTGEEFFLKGHFPGHPVVPGVILCEIMAQSGSLLVKGLLQGRTPLYAGIDGVRFKQAVRPGDTIEICARILSQRQMLVQIEAEATVAGKRCASGKLSFMLIDNDKLNTK